jgi:hypothetical protein
MESSGPETKVRGPASHIYERYLQLSRDAASSGDRVLSENYAQHADHYFRLVRAMQPAAPVQQAERFNDGEFEGDDDGAPENESMREGANEGDGGGSDADQPDVDFPQGQQQQQFNGEGRGRRNRRRFRPEGEQSEPRDGNNDVRAERQDRPERAEGQERPQRSERQDRPERSEQRPEQRAEGQPAPERQRRERQPRSDNAEGEQGGREGFSNGPKPAFLRNE